MSKKNNLFKETEIGTIPVDWRIDSINNTSTLHARIGWQGLTTREYLNTGEYMLIGGVNFDNGKVDWDSCFFVDVNRYNQDKNIQIRPYDILVTKDGTIGKVAYIGEDYRKATLNSGVFVIRPLNSVYYPKYMYYIFMSKYFKKFLEKLSAGSTIVHLYQKDFIHFKFPLPPYEEQQKIATALSDVDDLIASLEKIISKKKKIKKATMQQLLTGKKRLPGFTDKWFEKRIEELAEIVNGGTPSTKNPKYWNGDIAWCTPTDITNTSTKYISKTEKTITKEGLQNSSATLLPKGALLLCTRATIGEVKIAAGPIATNQGFKSLICKKGVSNEFLYYMLMKIKNKLIEKAIGSTFLEISKKDISSITIKIPTYSEQKAIASVISDMDAEIELLEKKLKKYRMIKEGMMQELLTGRIRLV